MIVHTVSPLYNFYQFDMLGWWHRMALALPSVKPLWKAMRMLARATARCCEGLCHPSRSRAAFCFSFFIATVVHKHDSLKLSPQQDWPLAVIRAMTGLQKRAHDLTACDVMQAKLTHMSMSLKSHRRRQEILGGPVEVLLDRLLDIAVNNPFCSPILRGIHQAISGAHLRTEFLNWSFMKRGSQKYISAMGNSQLQTHMVA